MKEVSFFVIDVLKIVFHGLEGPFQMPIQFFFGTSQCVLFSYLFSVGLDTIENHLCPFHIIVDKNQEFIH